MMRGLRTGGRIVRLGAMFLALVMALTLVPATAFAAGIEDYITFTNSKKGSQDLDIIVNVDGTEAARYTYPDARLGGSTIRFTSANAAYDIVGYSTNGYCQYTASTGWLTCNSNRGAITVNLRSRHTVTVQYVYADNSESNASIPTKTTQKYTVNHGEEFNSSSIQQEHYTYSVTPAGTNVTLLHKIRETINADTVFTVTYTPKNTDSLLFLDCYASGDGELGAREAIRLDGYVLSNENATERTYLVKDGALTAAFAAYQTRTWDGEQYALDRMAILLANVLEVYYQASNQTWYYKHTPNVPIAIPKDEGRLNLWYEKAAPTPTPTATATATPTPNTPTPNTPTPNTPTPGTPTPNTPTPGTPTPNTPTPGTPTPNTPTPGTPTPGTPTPNTPTPGTPTPTATATTTPTPKPTQKPGAPTPEPDIPKTGDDAPIGLYSAVVLVAAAGLAASAMLRKRRQRS